MCQAVLEKHLKFFLLRWYGNCLKSNKELTTTMSPFLGDDWLFHHLQDTQEDTMFCVIYPLETEGPIKRTPENHLSIRNPLFQGFVSQKCACGVLREWDFLLPPRLKIEEKGPKWLQGAEVELANSHAEWWIFQLYVEKQLKLWFYKLPPARLAPVRKIQINTISEKRRKKSICWQNFLKYSK